MLTQTPPIAEATAVDIDSYTCVVDMGTKVDFPGKVLDNNSRIWSFIYIWSSGLPRKFRVY